MTLVCSVVQSHQDLALIDEVFAEAGFALKLHVEARS